MKASLIIALFVTSLFFIRCKEQKKVNNDLIIGAGKMPNLARDMEGDGI